MKRRTAVGLGMSISIAGCLRLQEAESGDDGTESSSERTEDDSSESSTDDESDDETVGEVDSGPTEINWVMNPTEEEIDIQVQYAPLFEYIESEVDIEIVGQPTADYSATVAELQRASEGDRVFADTSPGVVAQIGEEIDVTGMRVAFGAEKYFSLITTTPDSEIESLNDLEGETIASAAPTSVSGTLFPLLMLKNAGLDIGGAPGTSPEDFELRTSDHTTARDQMIADDSIAASATGAFSTAPHVPQEQFHEESQEFVNISDEYDSAGIRDPELQLLGVSDPIPRAPIVSNATWNEPIKEDVREAITGAPDEVFEQLWFSGVVEATHGDYDPIVELGQSLGLDWGDL